MTTFILLHGGWHGGWSWDLVRPYLETAGHDVQSPTFSGLAERAGELTRETTLDSHVSEIVDLISARSGGDIALVGHSYGGAVMTAVSDRLPARLARLIYLDGFVPADGQSVFDVLPTSRRDYLQRLAATGGGGWTVPAPPPESFGVTDSEIADWARGLLTPQPLASLTQKIKLSGAGAAVPRTYIHCTQGALVASFAPFYARFSVDSTWSTDTIETGHDAMLTEPERVAALMQDHLK